MRLWRRREEDAIEDDLRLIVGLGNPGSRFEGTRHNIGFVVCETLAATNGLRFRRSKHRADIARGVIDGLPVLMALPVTYMNESGIAVRRLLDYFRIPRERMIVVCDDIDLPFGTVRLRPGGSAGGQKGLKSIIGELGSEEFARTRLGVGRPSSHAISHVLGHFPPEEERLLPALAGVAGEATLFALRQGVPAAMNRYNRDWLPELSVE